MKISVIIINYNTFGLSSACIRSVMKFTTGIPYEIILVDNGSKECAPEKFLEEFPSVKLIASPENLGFSAGNNLGISHSTGDTILLLNSDTELNEDSISACYQKLQAEKNTGVITCMLRYPNGEIQKQCQRFPSVKREFLQTSRFIRFLSKKSCSDYFLGPWFDHKNSCEPDWVWGAFFMFRKEILEIFPEKKLPETYFMYGEDIEWSYLVRQSGKSILYFAETAVIHHLGSSSEARKSREMFTHEKDFIIRYYGNAFWKRWRFWRLLNYRISKGKNPAFGQYAEILKGL